MIRAYEAIITPDEQGYSVEFPDIEGCVTQGNDLQDAYLMAYDALGLAVQEIIEAGDFLPDPAHGHSVPTEGTKAVFLINTDNLDFTEQYVTVREACDMLGVSSQRVQALIRSGDIISTKKGTCRLVDQQSIIDYRNRRTRAGRPKKVQA